MSNYLILLLMTLPVVAEVLTDKRLWSRMRDDKPLSTILRGVYFAALAVAFSFMGWAMWWQTLILASVTHTLLFDTAINIFREDRKPLFYHSKYGWWDKFWGWAVSIHWGVEVGLKLWLYYVGWIFFFHFEWVQGDYPSRLIEYFMF